MMDYKIKKRLFVKYQIKPSLVSSSLSRNSSGKPLKVAGLTVLACLLLAGQAFTAYYIVGQKDHLHALEQGQDTLKKELTRMLTGMTDRKRQKNEKMGK